MKCRSLIARRNYQNKVRAWAGILTPCSLPCSLSDLELIFSIPGLPGAQSVPDQVSLWVCDFLIY